MAHTNPCRMEKRERQNLDDEGQSSDEGSEIEVDTPGESPSLRTGIYTSEVGSYDVLLGRGTGPSMNKGNIHFRDTVESLKSSYISTPSRKVKKRIINKIVNDIKVKNGRFLNKLTKSEIKMLGLSSPVLYEAVPNDAALEKTKQAIRYVHYKKDSNRKKIPTQPAAKRLKRDDLPVQESKPTFSGVPALSCSPRMTPTTASSLNNANLPPLTLNDARSASLMGHGRPNQNHLQMMSAAPFSASLLPRSDAIDIMYSPAFNNFLPAVGFNQTHRPLPMTASLPSLSATLRAGVAEAALSSQGGLSRLEQTALASSLGLPAATFAPVAIDSVWAAEAALRFRAMAALAAQNKQPKESTEEG